MAAMHLSPFAGAIADGVTYKEAEALFKRTAVKLRASSNWP